VASSKLVCQIKLPSNFRLEPFLDFYQRDTQQTAEQVNVQENYLLKGMMWNNQPACLRLDFNLPDRVHVSLDTEALLSAASKDFFVFKVKKMLGLTQDIETFERTHETHSELGTIIQKNRGFRVPVTATSFEALTWAIIGQQISLKAAISLRRKWIQAVGKRHHNGLWCYPDALSALCLNVEQLRALGFSYHKARTLLAVSQLVQSKELPLEQWEQSIPVESIMQTLMPIPGIGPWTINYTLLRGFGWLDGSLHADIGMQRGLQRLQNAETKITATAAQEWLMQFAPWRALATTHVWHYYTSLANP
jgi:DNA-3-methyladenine glycosylase II